MPPTIAPLLELDVGMLSAPVCTVATNSDKNKINHINYHYVVGLYLFSPSWLSVVVIASVVVSSGATIYIHMNDNNYS